MTLADTITDPDQPIPHALTPKADAALLAPPPVPGVTGWRYDVLAECATQMLGALAEADPARVAAWALLLRDIDPVITSAYDALTGHAEYADRWTCTGCGFEFCHDRPAAGLCPGCLATYDEDARTLTADDLTAAELAEAEAQARWEREADGMWWETVRHMDAAGLLGDPADAEDAQ